MSNKNEQFEQRAKEFFADKKNANIKSVYFTSDGNMFRADHYADNWSSQLKDKTIVTIKRESKVQGIIDQVIADKFGDDSTTTAATLTEEDERAALIKRYIELFDTKPKSAHNIGLDKLRAQIAEKEAELENAGDPDGLKHIVTQEDLDFYPDLVEQGVKVGDEITLPNE